MCALSCCHRPYFYSRPCGRGDGIPAAICREIAHFYSRPCGRGDGWAFGILLAFFISTHAPAGGATWRARRMATKRVCISTHAPAGGATCGEGERFKPSPSNFYSRPCGRGDAASRITIASLTLFLLTPLREGRRGEPNHYRIFDVISTHAPAGGATADGALASASQIISTHAPAGGATAIFHKSVMRFCGKLPKDDTVLCLASFGFPRRDPKAVYLAWISCANLPQKCVREGLALKDQGTSCFHEGLASHAFDPVLV